MTKALELAKFGRESAPTGLVVGDSDAQTLSSKTFSDNPVFSGGGINSITYLNASKVLTSNANFVFDGANMGLGTNSPVTKLHIGGAPIATSGALIYLRDTTAAVGTASLGGIAFFSAPGSDFYIGKKNNAAGTGWLSFGNADNGTEYAVIDANGRLGIGTASPTTILDVVKAATISTTDFIYSTTPTLMVQTPSNSTLNTAAIMLRATDTSNAVSAGSISVVPVANYRSNFIFTYDADGSGGNIIFNQFHPSNATTYERMRINSAGYVGIGSIAPTEVVTISNSNYEAFGIYRNLDYNSVGAMGSRMYFGGFVGSTATRSAAIDGTLMTPTTGAIAFSTLTAGVLTQKLLIDNAGNTYITGPNASAGTNLYIRNTTDTGGDNTRYAGIQFQIGSDYGTAAIQAYRTNSASDYSTALVFLTKGAGTPATTPTERMRLSSTGYLTVSNGATFNGQVNIGGNSLYFEKSGTRSWQLYASQSTGQAWLASGDGLGDFIIASSKVGIGTSTPSYTLHVAGTLYASGAIVGGSYASVGSIVANDPGANYYSWNNRIGGGIAIVGDSFYNDSLGIGISAPKQNAYGSNSAAQKLSVYYAAPANNTVDDVVRLTSKYYAASGASAAVGSGPAIIFAGGIGDNQIRDRARIAALYEGNNMSGLSFQTQTSADTIVEAMRITNNGRVGIGTASPTSKFEVNGSARVAGGTITAGELYYTYVSGGGTWQNFLTIPNNFDHTFWWNMRIYGTENGGVAFYNFTGYCVVRHNSSPYSDFYESRWTFEAGGGMHTASSALEFRIYGPNGDNGTKYLQVRSTNIGIGMGVHQAYLSTNNYSWG